MTWRQGWPDVGTVRVADDGTMSISASGDETRSFTFSDSVGEIRGRITIDDDAWHSVWPGCTLERHP